MFNKWNNADITQQSWSKTSDNLLRVSLINTPVYTEVPYDHYRCDREMLSNPEIGDDLFHFNVLLFQFIVLLIWLLKYVEVCDRAILYAPHWIAVLKRWNYTSDVVLEGANLQKPCSFNLLSFSFHFSNT